MAKLNYSHVYAAAGFSGESFDIAAGPANTDIIDVLLSVGNAALTSDAPHVLLSSGALFAGGVTLDISALEAESSAAGSAALNGRFFYLSVQNSNISAVNNIVISSSATINGAASFTISNTGDYIFHHVASGAWRVNILPTPAEKIATLARISFASTDWALGTANQIKVIAAGTPGAGEVGPHGLAAYSSYVVQVINTDLTPDEIVDAEIQIASNGDITILKAGLGAAFAGVVVIVGSLD